MSFATVCPHCHARQSARDSDCGEKIRCRECDERFVARPARGRNADQPRSRGRTKGKKSGVPILLIVLLAVGGVVVLGGIGGVVYLLFGKKGGPLGPSGSGGPPASTANWVEFADAQARYRVKFPQAPVTEERIEHRPDGPAVKQKHVVCRRPTVSFYTASNPLPAGSDPRQVLAREMNNAWGQTPWNGTVERRAGADHLGRPGRELTMSNYNERGFLRMYVANDRFIVLLAWGERLQADNPEVAAFFQSLTFD